MAESFPQTEFDPRVAIWTLDLLPPDVNEHTVAHNLQAIVGIDSDDVTDGTMQRLLQESLGSSGNDDTACIDGHHYPCVTIGGYYDNSSGAIFAFGDPQSLPPEAGRMFKPFWYRIAVSPQLFGQASATPIGGDFAIIGLSYGSEVVSIPHITKAQHPLEAAAAVYNFLQQYDPDRALAL
jgi:hypothetical protein